MLVPPLHGLRNLCSRALQLVGALTLLGIGAQAQVPDDLPFERLGQALLDAGAQPGDPSLDVEERFLRRVDPLFERIELGALELYLAERALKPDGSLARCKRPVEWKFLAEVALGVQRRWCDELGLLEGDAGAALAATLDELEAWLRRAPPTVRFPPPQKLRDTSARLRVALLGPDRARAFPVLIAPSRAHYLGVIGAAGLHVPNIRHDLWTDKARRSPSKALSQTMVLLALVYGPAQDGGSPFEEQRVDEATHRMYAAHAFSHQLANGLLPTAPRWFSEGLALLDTVRVTGSDETLCAGYAGRTPTAFDGWQSLPEWLFIFTRIERSPYRTGGSSDLFVDELRAARVEKGWEILDLDRSQVGLVARGPFLGDTARLPEEAVIGPKGLKEGFAEFFRAYCGAFAAWLGEYEVDGQPLLGATMRLMRERGLTWDGGPTQDLEEVLQVLSGLTIGATLDPERDLEGLFQAWLAQRR